MTDNLKLVFENAREYFRRKEIHAQTGTDVYNAEMSLFAAVRAAERDLDKTPTDSAEPVIRIRDVLEMIEKIKTERFPPNTQSERGYAANDLHIWKQALDALADKIKESKHGR